MLEVYFFAAARAAAGFDRATVSEPPSTLGELLTQLGAQGTSQANGMPLGEVLQRCSYLLDGRGVGGWAEAPGVELSGVRRVDVLPPFAGG